jgi:hypothetical protein
MARARAKASGRCQTIVNISIRVVHRVSVRFRVV